MATPFPTNWMLIGLPDVLDVVTTSVTVAVCVSEPLVPVIVSVGLPIGVLLVVVTVSVEDPAPVTDVGENDAVAPVGSPLVTLKLTAPPNPFSTPRFTVYVVLPPAATVCVPGVADIVKSGANTVKATVAVWVTAPLVPVIVSVGLPAGVLPAVVIVKIELPGALREAGANVAVAPVGRPLALRLTDPVNPLMAPTLTVYVVLPPALTVWVLGVADTVKSGLGTIWIPLIGARLKLVEAVLGIADNVKLATFGIVSTT
jgi:hypothetical protein